MWRSVETHDTVTLEEFRFSIIPNSLHVYFSRSSTLRSACKASSILSAYNNAGVLDQRELTKVQLGETAKPPNALTILGVNHHFSN